MFGLPLLFLIVSSFKPDLQIFADLTSIKAFLPVGDLTLDNYRGVFDRVPFATFMMNSIMISVCTVGLGLIVNSMAAFALSRITFKGQKLILGIILATLIVPFETMALPLLWWSNKLPFYDFVNGYSQGWLDTYQIQIVPFIANAFAIFLFYQYFDSIPKSLDEAATVDGAGWFRIYRSIIMPLSGPAIATVAILTFLPAWNQYLWPLMVVQTEELRPVMVGIDYFKQLNVSWGQLMAYATMITVPDPGAVHRLPALVHQLHRLLRRQGLMSVQRFPRRGCGTSGSSTTARSTTSSSSTPPEPSTTPIFATTGHRSATPSPTTSPAGNGSATRSFAAMPSAFDDLATWTGSVSAAPRRDLVHVLHRRHAHAGAGNVQRIGFATSEDLLTWRKKSATTRCCRPIRDGTRGSTDGDVARRGLPRPVGPPGSGRQRMAHAVHRPSQPWSRGRSGRDRSRVVTRPP